jgi:hypothetical protein
MLVVGVAGALLQAPTSGSNNNMSMVHGVRCLMLGFLLMIGAAL